jgi:hypothetical protein
MHLFLIDLFISIDTLAPLIYLQNKKSIICNVNPIQDHSKNNLIKVLVNNGSTYKKFIGITKNKIALFFFLQIAYKLPYVIQKKIYKIYFYIYNYTCFTSEKKIAEFLTQNNIKSITYEDSIPKIYIFKIAKSAKRYKIPLIKVLSGQTPFVKKKYSNNFTNINFCDYIFMANNSRNVKNKITRRKIRYFGALRYTHFWFSIIKNKIYFKNWYSFNKNKFFFKKKKKKIIIGFFLKHHIEYNNEVKDLLLKIKSNDNYVVLSREKPRDFMPLGCNKHDEDELSSSQLIEFSDFIITATTSSILLEALQKKKQVILLKYINKNLIYSPFYDLESIYKVNDEKEVFNIISYKKKINNSKINNYNNFLKKYLKYYKKESLLISKIKKFYSSC